MAKINKSTTGKIYIYISIGLLLLVQVIPIYPKELLRYKDCINKTTNHQVNFEGTLSREERNLNTKEAYDEDENKKDGAALLTRTLRMNDQVDTDERSHFPKDQWNALPLNNENIPSATKYYGDAKNNHSPPQETNDDGRIVFPADDTPYITSRFQPPTCDGAVLCDNVPNYPVELIEKQLSEREYLKYFQVQEDMAEISNRIGEAEDDPLCAIREEYIYPQAARTSDDGYKLVVNSKNFRQGIKVEICVNLNSRCRLVDGFASGYKTSCTQKYTHRQLLGINNAGTFTPYYFQIPTSCCCHVQFVGNVWERMAKGGSHKLSTQNKQRREKY